MLSLWFILPVTVLAQVNPPSLPANSQLLKKTALTISYNPKYKQADWVFYQLGKDQLKNCVSRGKGFRADPETPNGATLEDYKHSGYDRGHLSAAADNKWSAQAMDETFFLTNVCPQPPKFNEGIWSRLEQLVRAWALKTDLYVSTGPILKSDLQDSIGTGKISVAQTFYKVIITKDEKQAIGIEMNTDAKGELKAFATTVKKVEEDTGLTFSPGLSNKVKSTVDLSFWDFRAEYSPLPCE